MTENIENTLENCPNRVKGFAENPSSIEKYQCTSEKCEYQFKCHDIKYCLYHLCNKDN